MLQTYYYATFVPIKLLLVLTIIPWHMMNSSRSNNRLRQSPWWIAVVLELGESCDDCKEFQLSQWRWWRDRLHNTPTKSHLHATAQSSLALWGGHLHPKLILSTLRTSSTYPELCNNNHVVYKALPTIWLCTRQNCCQTTVNVDHVTVNDDPSLWQSCWQHGDTEQLLQWLNLFLP